MSSLDFTKVYVPDNTRFEVSNEDIYTEDDGFKTVVVRDLFKLLRRAYPTYIKDDILQSFEIPKLSDEEVGKVEPAQKEFEF